MRLFGRWGSSDVRPPLPPSLSEPTAEDEVDPRTARLRRLAATRSTTPKNRFVVTLGGSIEPTSVEVDDSWLISCSRGEMVTHLLLIDRVAELCEDFDTPSTGLGVVQLEILCGAIIDHDNWWRRFLTAIGMGVGVFGLDQAAVMREFSAEIAGLVS